MGEYAPAAIMWLANEITGSDGIGSAQLSGVIGDASHHYGYHRCRNVLPSDDYSVVLAKDRKGDGWAASALDISYGPADQKAVTARLLAACKAKDARVVPYVREFFGTLNGSTVTGWDNHSNSYSTSDDSHLWHVHLSFYREYATNQTIMAGIRDVILGRAKEDELPSVKEVWQTDGMVPAPEDSASYKANPSWTAGNALAEAVRASRSAEKLARALTATLDPAKLAGALAADLRAAGVGQAVSDEQLDASLRRVLGSLDQT